MAEDIVLGARQLSNPDNVSPKMDTDPPDAYTPAKGMGNISNPKAVVLMPPKQSELEKHFAKPKSVRHPLGPRVPKSTLN